MNQPTFYPMIISILTLVAACKGPVSVNEQPAQAADENIVVLDSLQVSNAGISLTFPEEREMHTSLRVNGLVDVPPQGQVSVSFPLGGYLVSTPLLPGYPVHKGEIIAHMEDQSYVQLEQDYLTARAKMEYLSQDVQRQKELSDADATSKKNYQSVLSEYKVQEVLLRSLAEKLRLIHIDPDHLSLTTLSGTLPVYSPINGYVNKVNVNIGKYVNPSDVLFELVNPDDIHAAITVFEKDIDAFKKGLRGRVALVDKPNEWYHVKVILVTKNIDDNRSGMVHCHFENPGPGLLPGMFLTGIFELDHRKAIVVPDEAVVRYMGKEYVFIADDRKRFVLTPVITGGREDGRVELTPSGTMNWLQSRVVVKGAYALLGKLKNKMGDE